MHTALIQMSLAIEKLKMVEKILSEFGVAPDEESLAQLENDDGFCIAHSAERSGYSLHWGVGLASPQDENNPDFCVTLFVDLLGPKEETELDIAYFVDDDAWQGECSPDLLKKHTTNDGLMLDKILEQDFDDNQAVKIIALMAQIFSNLQQHSANVPSNALN